MTKIRNILISTISMMLVACGGSSGNNSNGGPQPPLGSICTESTDKQSVLSIMQEWYLWNDLAPQFNKYNNINLASYASADTLLDYLRYEPSFYDRRFSYITTPQAEQSFLGEGQFTGFGFSMVAVTGANDIRFAQVYEASPASDAGFQRGDKIVELNNRTIAAINAAEGINAVFGPSEVGITVSFKIEPRNGGALLDRTLVKRLVTINPVRPASTLSFNAGTQTKTAAYLLFRTFISTAPQKLRDEFALLKTQDIRNLIVDLRYNGGGLLRVADIFSGLLGGASNTGNILYRLSFNGTKAPGNNQVAYFPDEFNKLDLDKIIFITGNGSASASELVINSLLPYFNIGGMPKKIVIVGAPSYGKPVGQIAFDFCNNTKRMRVVAFKSVNVSGAGDYFNGLPVDCAIADDFTHALGDVGEAAIAGALRYLETGTCPVVALAPTKSAELSSGAEPFTTQMIRGAGIEKELAGAY